MGETPVVPSVKQCVRVRYWASARAAAGVPADELATDVPLSLSEVRRRVIARHPGTRLPNVLAACSAIVGEQPVGSADPDEVMVRPGDSVDFLPPFAGG